MSKKHFEANMLDGDEIQQGQMLSSESVWEYIQEFYIKRADVLEAIEEDILGCDRYEKETDSIVCQWCGQTEFSSNHAKARVKEKLNLGDK